LEKPEVTAMDEREAFHRAVRVILTRDWDPVFPDHPSFDVGGRLITVRQVCDRMRKLFDRLPDGVETDLFDIFHRWSDRDLQTELRVTETYSMAAKCLIKFMDRRITESVIIPKQD
jgi:hypothetical protein